MGATREEGFAIAAHWWSKKECKREHLKRVEKGTGHYKVDIPGWAKELEEKRGHNSG